MRFQELPAQQREAMRALFQVIFGTGISQAFLDWKYGDGRGRCYGVFSEGGALLAHCGLTFRPVVAEHRAAWVAQLGDLMVAPAAREGLARGSSVFHRLFSGVLAAVPDARNPEGLIFGFPSDRAMRLGQRLGLLASVGVMHELVFEPRQPARSWWWGVRPLAASEASFQREADRLWGRMAGDFGAGLIGVRDAAYLRRRYVGHPEHRYDLFRVLPPVGRCIGLAVLRRQGDEAELMDIVAAREDMCRVVAALQRRLPAMGVRALRFWVTDRHAACFAGLYASATALQFRIAANPASSNGHPERFKDRWWLTSGDADYR